MGCVEHTFCKGWLPRIGKLERVMEIAPFLSLETGLRPPDPLRFGWNEVGFVRSSLRKTIRTVRTID